MLSKLNLSETQECPKVQQEESKHSWRQDDGRSQLMGGNGQEAGVEAKAVQSKEGDQGATLSGGVGASAEAPCQHLLQLQQ